MSDVRGLVDYLEDFIAQNTIQGDTGVALDLSPEEYQALADFLFKGMVTWMLGVERARWCRRRTLVEVTRAEQPEPHGEAASEANDGSNNVIIWRAL